MVEVISSLETDGRRIPYDIRMGVWVTVEAETEYIKNCFEEYNAHTDPSGRYFTLYKRWHLIGLEVGMSVASVALRGEPTGAANFGAGGWNADVVATATYSMGVSSVFVNLRMTRLDDGTILTAQDYQIPRDADVIRLTSTAQGQPALPAVRGQNARTERAPVNR